MVPSHGRSSRKLLVSVPTEPGTCTCDQTHPAPLCAFIRWPLPVIQDSKKASLGRLEATLAHLRSQENVSRICASSQPHPSQETKKPALPLWVFWVCRSSQRPRSHPPCLRSPSPGMHPCAMAKMWGRPLHHLGSPALEHLCTDEEMENHRQQNSKAKQTLFWSDRRFQLCQRTVLPECHLVSSRSHPTTAPISQPAGLNVHHRGLKASARGMFLAWFGSRASVGSEVSGSHVRQLIRGSPDLALEDTSLSLEGKQCLHGSLQSHQPDAPRHWGPDGVWERGERR